VAHYRLSSTKQGSKEPLKDEIDAHCLLLKVLSISSYHPNSQRCILRGSAQTAEVTRVRPEIANTWFLHHDNAPRHASLLVSGEKPVATLPQPPYSPDLAPPDFVLFRWNKSSLKGHHFGTVKNVQAAVTNALKEIPVQDFHASYDAWQNGWQRGIDDQGCYFEYCV
jgi:hypothetical protein